MNKKLRVNGSIAESLQAFLIAEDIAINFAEDADVSVVKCDEHKESSLQILYSGGWIACETARSLAKELGVSMPQMGKILNFLSVKIRKCSLGCFQ